MHTLSRTTVLAALLVTAATALAADDACGRYKWDVTAEVKLYATSPTTVTAAAAAAQAPAIHAGTHYTLTLQPQEQVQYLVAPSKRMLADGAFGGLLKFSVPRAGAYRVAIDAGFWLDVVRGGESLPTLDFNGVRECVGPRKIVVFEMPADTELWLQLAASSSETAQLTVTPAAAPAP